jgi:hypothetical protein
VAATAVSIIRYLRPLFDDSSATLWTAALGLDPPASLGYLSFVIASAIAVTLAVAGTARMVGSENRLAGLFILSVCVVAAYAVVYRIFTGYIYSGYLNRQAPFLVFWTDIVLGGAVYVVIETTRRAFADSWANDAPGLLPISGSTLLLFFFAAWFTLQLSYLVVVPPDSAAFLKLLSARPFRGSSFVVNSYAAPEAEKTHAWAYAETSLFSGRARLQQDGFQVEHDRQYLWFADAETNKAYLKPDYGLMVDLPASISEALKELTDRRSRAETPIAFPTSGLVRRTQEPLEPFLQHKLAATDGSRYSIIKFDWDFPPFLKPVDAALLSAAQLMSFEQRLSFSQSSREQRSRWRIEIEPRDVVPLERPGRGPVQLVEASVDGKPVFSREAFVAADWLPGPGQVTGSPGTWIGLPGRSGKISAVVVGNAVALRFLEGPGRGRATVQVNDMEQTIDFGQPRVRERLISLTAEHPRDRFTAIPAFTPGMYVTTSLAMGSAGPVAAVEYVYSNQDGVPESGTVFRVYQEVSPEVWRLADTLTFLGTEGILVRLEEFKANNPDTLSEYSRMRSHGETRTYLQWLTDHLTAYPKDRNRKGILAAGAAPLGTSTGTGIETRVIPLPDTSDGRLQISVTPSTRTKAGPEYFGLPFDASRAESAPTDGISRVEVEAKSSLAQKDFPYGWIHLRLRFPANRVPQAEPIVSAGVEEAGDFVYVVYSDSSHIRIGFDHWFKGGPLSPPIPIDYAKDHDVDISMGSLYPPGEDFVFFGMSPKWVASLKETVWVKVDGNPVIQAPSEFWDASPGQVTIGRNDIKGTTSNPRFTGEIIECKRVWPEPQ